MTGENLLDAMSTTMMVLLMAILIVLALFFFAFLVYTLFLSLGTMVIAFKKWWREKNENDF